MFMVIHGERHGAETNSFVCCLSRNKNQLCSIGKQEIFPFPISRGSRLNLQSAPPFSLILGILMSPIIADNVENKWLERIHCHLISSLLQLGNLSFYVELLFTSIYA